MKQDIESLGSTMSVPEMRRLLGLKKTESYWLVHRNFFETRIINGRMRVDRASFEKWYANQTKHKKVNGESPGEKLRQNSFSFQEAATLLGVYNSIVYDIWKKEELPTVMVDFVKRIPADAFWKWYESQSKYRVQDRILTKEELEADYIPLQKAADMLGITMSAMCAMVRSRLYMDYLDMKYLDNKRWVSKKNFQDFLNVQDIYQVVHEKKNRKDGFPGERVVLLETKDYLSRKEAAVLANVSLSTITKWTQQELFPCVGAGNVLRIPRDEFLKWLRVYRRGGR